MKLIIGRVFSILITGGGWALAGVRTVLDLIGYSTSPEDVGVAVTRLDQFLGWLLSLPWWVPWGFAIISTACLMWVSWPRGQAAAVKRVELGPPAPPDQETVSQEARIEELKERRWATTSDYDLPIKLRAINDLLAIVGAERELEQAVREGKTFLDSWLHQIKRGNIKELKAELQGYIDKVALMWANIGKIKRETELYDDIQYILRPREGARIAKPLSTFWLAITKLGDNPTGDFQWFLEQFVEEAENSLKGVGRWRFETEKALIARRKELSG